MRTTEGPAVLSLLACLAAAAQGVPPRIGYVYPAGGQQGTTCRVEVGGQYLSGVTNVWVSGAGVRATVLAHARPLTQKEFNELREKLRELQQRRQSAARPGGRGAVAGGGPASTNTWTAADEQVLAEIRRKLANPPNRQGNPAIAETVTLSVTMASDVESGDRELRLGSPAGLSNPLLFQVGQLPEFSEAAARGDRPASASGAARPRRESEAQVPDPETWVRLPAVLNGQILPGDVDRFRFTVRRGDHLVAVVSARALIPYLADAVPGWFQATLTLRDATGRELAYADDHRFNPDPVLHFEVPRDGDYVVEIRDSLYRGREDFVYRLAMGELPFVTSHFPLGGPVSNRTSVELHGWNVPTTPLVVDAPKRGIMPLQVRSGVWVSNRVPFAMDTLPERREEEPNGRRDQAQVLHLPVIVNGRIDQADDWDVFCFEGRSGEVIVAEVQARRLNSPLDAVLRLTDAAGRQLAFNDDHEDRGAGLTTHHADPEFSVHLPADGAYCVHLGDAQQHGGEEYAYRLRLSPPRPDFELRVAPSSINGRAGGTVPLAVYALRKDGFSGEIALVLSDPPSGFSLGGGRLPAGQDHVRVTLTIATRPGEEPRTLQLEGRAMIEARNVVRQAVPADDVMQAFAYRHLVAAQELKVSVSGQGRPGPRMAVLDQMPVRIPAGGTARVRLGAPARALTGRFRLELNQPPEGITLQEVAVSRDATTLVLRSDAAKARPGLAGNLIVQMFAASAPSPGGSTPSANRRRAPLDTLPAIPFEIVGQ